MIRIKPDADIFLACPCCGAEKTKLHEVSVPGTHWIVHHNCIVCGSSFIGSLPVGHTIDLQLHWDKTKHKLFTENTADVRAIKWLPAVFEKFVTDVRTDNITIRKLIFKKTNRVVILNTLDAIYGHSLLKLYNAQYHLDKNEELGLVLIVSKSFEWLIPSGCAEAWVVDLPLGDLKYSHSEIDKFVQKEMMRFAEVFVSKAYSHPDFSKVDIERFTGIRPFDLNTFNSTTPCFTFVLRADRPWLRNGITGGFHWLFMKFKMLKLVEGFFAADQNYLVKTTIAKIKRHIPTAEIFVTGFGKRGHFKDATGDERYDKVNDEIERKWCSIYSKSHIVIGVHGSNMLLPTAFAAGCLEILPEFRTYNIAQDLSVRYNDKRQIFLYRFVDQFISPRTLATKAIAMVKDYNSFYRNMILNVYKD